jgi:hypothetical protein
MQYGAAFWQDYADLAAEFSRQANNIYLKANNQPEGVKSYGRMVDLLLAYYAIPSNKLAKKTRISAFLKL